MGHKIVVSGASGDLGRKVTALLLKSIPPADLTLVTRSPVKLEDRAQQGVRVMPGDYNNPEQLRAAYAGSDTLLLISGLDVTNRVPEHRNAIEAARSAGIRHIVYTSVAGIHPRNPTLSASDHIVTENDLHQCGLAYSIMRNQTYAEVFPTIAAQPVLRTGEWVQVEGSGHLAPVSKLDIARCAAAMLLAPEQHRNATYEITGPELVTFRDIAALTAEVYETPIRYVELSVEERYARFDAMGIPRSYSDDMQAHPDAHMWCSDEMVTADIAFQQDFHAIMSRHVHFITGQEPETLREVYARCKGKDYAEC